MNINGYTLKAVKHFMGNEGYGFSANLYYNNKKIGEVTDTANGSCEIDIYLDMKHEAEHGKNLDTDFIERLYRLGDQEKSFKDMMKKTPDKALICVTFSKPTKNGDYYLEYHGSKGMTEEIFTEWHEKINSGGQIEKIEIFTSLDDFNIQDAGLSEDLLQQQNGMTMS